MRASELLMLLFIHFSHYTFQPFCRVLLPTKLTQVLLLTHDEGHVVRIEGGYESSAELDRLLAKRGGALQSEEVRGLDKPKLPLKWLGQMLALLVLAVALSLLALALVDRIGSASILDAANLTQPATHARADG
uniref:Uncharacterized protein n=1 Tax=Chrysotila carterae TaxID=13221 RepID=A0A7S4B7U9_CHRCT